MIRERVRAFPAEQIGEIVDSLIEQIQLSRQPLDLGFGAAIDVEIEFAAQAVFGVLAILAHHDDRRLDGGEHGEKQVEQDERVGIPGLCCRG